MFLVLQACTHFLHLLLSIHHSCFGFSLLCAAQLGSGLIPLMILDGSSLADAPRYVPAGWWDDWCEAGTRRGHYNWGGLQAGGMAGARTTTDVDYRQVGRLVRGRHKARPLQLVWTTGWWDGWWEDWCEAGTRRGHYNWCGLQAGGMAGGKTGARPAQGAATTTDVDYRQVDCWCCFLWGRTLHGAIVAYGHRPGGHISTNKQRTSTEWRYASLSKGFFG